MYESTKAKARDRFDADDCFDTLDNDFSTTNDSENHNEIDEEGTDLFLKLSKIVNRNQCVCFPKFEQSVSILFHGRLLSARPIYTELCCNET